MSNSSQKRNQLFSIHDFSLTNPKKILYPIQGITKFDLANYYFENQTWILPQIIKRPLTLVRCPKGRHKKCFYQKHLINTTLKDIFPVNIQEKKFVKPYPYIANIRGLLSLVQMGTLEIHLWNCHIDQIEKPDLFVLDLDPDENVAWKKVITTAHLIREKLSKLNLVSFVRTTGGKGLHVVVPIKRYYTWEEVKKFTRHFVMQLVEQYPSDYTGTMSKAKRHGKIFIDFFRNDRGATSIASYSTRAKPNAPIATPLFWEELTVNMKSDTFNIHNIQKRLASLKNDPWKDFLTLKQKLNIPKLIR